MVENGGMLEFYAKTSAKQQEKQLTDFMDEVTNGELSVPKQTAPVWELPSGAPLIVP